MSNREFFFHLCTSEFPRFLGVLQATPGDRLDYQPHPRSRSGHQFVAHLIAHELDLCELADTGIVNHRIEVPFATIDEAVQFNRDAHESLEPQIAALDDAAWKSMGQFVIKARS